MRQKLKEFIKRHDLKLVFLHSETGISETALRRILKTDLPVRTSNVIKLANFLTIFGFTNVDFDGLLKMLVRSAFSIDYSTDERCMVSSLNCFDEVLFNPKLIKDITYSPQENGWLFCEVIFFNGSRIIFNHQNFKTTL